MNQPPRPFLAVISDMDGVITRTASLHRQAWREMFDGFLEARRAAARPGEDLAPFSDADYREHLDGKARLTGVRDFLASRGVDLPEGAPDDPPARDTVYGLGARKNVRIVEVLDRDGVEVFGDTIGAFDRWQRGGLAVAVISASRNCRRVLQAAGQLARFDALVDGQTAAEENLRGKAAQIAYAARKLGIEPARCVLLEDATSGVSAGREAGCGLVVGVDRAGGDHRDALRRAGADLVVEDVASLRFLRSIPTVHQKRRLFDDLRAGRPLCLFLDFDGTLSPIVPDPAAASISAGLRATVRRLADRQTVAVISGRDLDDVRRRMGIEGLFYAGSHGLDIVGPGRAMAHPDAEAAAGAVDRAESALHQLVGEVPGTVIERKRFSVAAHYRMVDPAHAERVKTAAVRAAAADDRLQARHGKMVVEILPDIAWDKGRAVAWLLEALTVDPRETLVIHIGDDETDEDAFLALAGRGLGIFVGPEANASLADLRLEDPAAVETFLEGLHEI